MSLTRKQQQFVDEYVLDHNAAAAARRAGYSARTATNIGSENLTKPDIIAAIQAKMAHAPDFIKVKADDVWRELGNIATSSMADLIDFTGPDLRLKAPSAIPEHAIRALASCKVKRYTEGIGDQARQVEMIEFRFWDKPKVLIELAKIFGMLKDRVEVTGARGAPIEVKATVIDTHAKILSYANEFRDIALRELAEEGLNGDGHENGQIEPEPEETGPDPSPDGGGGTG